MDSNCQMEPGTSLPVLPKSSGCSRMARPGAVFSCSVKALAVKSTSSFAMRAWSRDEPRSQGNPRRNFLDLIGRGPFRLALRAPEKEPHGGEAATKW